MIAVKVLAAGVSRCAAAAGGGRLLCLATGCGMILSIQNRTSDSVGHRCFHEGNFKRLRFFSRLPGALVRGAVPLNPLGWFGYGELMEVSVDRSTTPLVYWMIVTLMAVLSVMIACFIVVIARGSAGVG